MDLSISAAGTSMDASFYHYINDGPENRLQIAVADGVDEISLLISAKNGTLPLTNPKAIKDEILKVVAQPKSIDTIRRTRYSKLLIVVKSVQAAQSILNVKQFFNLPVDVHVIKDTITTRFLLHNMDTIVSCSEIAEELQSSGITALEVRRFLRKIDNSSSPTTTVLVTKLGTNLPSSVKLWYQDFRASPFWDNPRACRKCYQYNHSTASCHQKQRCHRCGEEHGSNCHATNPMCINCKGEHDALDKICPCYQRELEIQKFKSRHHLTIDEARRRFSDSEKSKGVSIDQVLSSPSVPPPVALDYATKADLERSIQSFSQTFSNTMQEFLVQQQQSLQEMLERLSQAITDMLSNRFENLVREQAAQRNEKLRYHG